MSPAIRPCAALRACGRNLPAVSTARAYGHTCQIPLARCRVEVPVTRHLPHRSHRAAFPQWALVEGQTRSRVGAWQPNLPPTRRRAASVTRRPGSESGACVAARLSFDRPPFLHSLRCRFVVGFVRGFIGTTQPSDSSRLPQQLRLLDFLSWPGIAVATAGGVRSPRFRRDPFIRDVASDPGRATVPCVPAPHMLPSAVATASAPATSRISWLNPTPHMITVYASPWSSPSPTQHSLPGGRYPLPGPDFHRLDRASFAWRTATSLTSSSECRAAVPSALARKLAADINLLSAESLNFRHRGD